MYSVYPVRTNKEKYTIPLIRRHECTMGCYLSLSQDEYGNIHISPNPRFRNGICTETENYEWSVAQIVDPINWRGIERLDEIVIADPCFTFTINFPIQHPRTIKVENHSDSGFTRRDLLTIIRFFYNDTYTTEMETATQTTIQVTTPCNTCKYATPHDKVETVTLDTEETCSVCLCGMKEECGKLGCGHLYHQECITEWIDHANSTCPLCRTEIMTCDTCNGTRYVTVSYQAAVPERSAVPFGARLLTDGSYGVYNYYIEDLALQNMTYDHSRRQLTIEVCPLYQ